MTKMLAVLIASRELVATALPGALVLGFEGDTSFPTLVPAGGLVIGFPGDPGDPAVDLSPPCYTYEHSITLQVSAAAGGGPEALDAMIGAIGVAVAADPFLGGLCSSLTATAPLRQERMEEEEVFHWAEFSLVAEYSVDSPLG